MFSRVRFRAAKFTQTASRTLWTKVKTVVSENKDHIPPSALFIGICALCFQVTVLYPWHEQLNHEFIKIQGLTSQVSDISKRLDEKFDRLLIVEEEIKIKEKKILEREDAILQREVDIDSKLDLLISLNINMHKTNDIASKASSDVAVQSVADAAAPATNGDAN